MVLARDLEQRRERRRVRVDSMSDPFRDLEVAAVCQPPASQREEAPNG